MAKIYFYRVQSGTVTNINDVPGTWREKVRTMLEENGYIVEENGSIFKIVN